MDPKLKEIYERVMSTPVRSADPQNTLPQMSVKSPSPQTHVVSPKKRGVSPILIVLTAIIFFLVYAFVWIKIFNLKIPFLPF